MIKRIGIVVMLSLSVGGGVARVTVDLINSLKKMGKEIYLLTPYRLNYEKIEELYGPIVLKKIYNPSKAKAKFCRGAILSRKLMKKEFKNMAKEVDMIIDIDGGVLQDYLPESFDKSKYFVWRLCCTKFQKTPWMKKSFKKKVKNRIQEYLLDNPKNQPKKDYQIFALDKWTKKELIENWGLTPEEECLYPAIQVNELLYNGKKKKNQMVVLGRISPDKRVEESIKIFSKGTKNHIDYNLVVLGGVTNDSTEYIKDLEKMIEDLGISDRVELIKSPSFSKIKEVLLDSKILIDSQEDISMTMTAVEAMAAGNIVLARKNAGTYLDILDNGTFGYGFDNIEEASIKLEEILKKLKTGKLDIQNPMKRAMFFSLDNFNKRLKEVLNE